MNSDNYNNTWEIVIERLKKEHNYQDLIKSCYYDDPVENAIERFRNSEEWKTLIDLIDKYKLKNAITLDFGAGRGISSYLLAKKNFKVYALDYNNGLNAGLKSIKNLCEKDKIKIENTISSFDTLPYEDNFFDFVHARQALHHSKNLNITCNQISRVMKKGGIFISLRDHIIDHPKDKAEFLNNHPLHKYTKDENAFTLEEYCQAFKKSNLRLMKIYKTYSSPLNFSPTKIEDILKHYTKNKLVFDNKIIKKILFAKNNIGSLFRGVLTFLIDKKNKTPGRAYSFLLKKI